jgi:hypothetical protein
MESPISYFTGLTDPRVDRTKVYLLDEIVFIAIVSVLCGAETRLLSLPKYGMTWKNLANQRKSGCVLS